MLALYTIYLCTDDDQDSTKTVLIFINIIDLQSSETRIK